MNQKKITNHKKTNENNTSMKTTSITVERNFHILNDDRFIMEKISATKMVHEDENEQDVINQAREAIVANFKAAYPKVYTHLNFDATIQRDEKLWDEHVTKPAFEKHFNIKLPTDAEFDERNDNLKLPTTIPEKINKGTIEEQIQACTTPEELKSFKIIAYMNDKLTKQYDLKMNELSPNASTKSKSIV